MVPVGEAGAGFVTATADRLGVPAEPVVVGDRVGLRAQGRVAHRRDPARARRGGGAVPYAASSLPLGRLVAAALPDGGALLVDLVGDDVHDGGAGFLAALGAEADVDLTAGVAGLDGISRLDLDAPRRRLAGLDLVGVVPGAQLSTPLLGLRGITSVRGRAAGEDARTAARRRRGPPTAGRARRARPGRDAGAGACGGTGLAVLALGGRLTSGPELALGGVAGPVDLVVTGCSVFDFAHRGGGVVAAAAALAGRLLAPCVVVAGRGPHRRAGDAHDGDRGGVRGPRVRAGRGRRGAGHPRRAGGDRGAGSPARGAGDPATLPPASGVGVRCPTDLP